MYNSAMQPSGVMLQFMLLLVQCAGVMRFSVDVDVLRDYLVFIWIE